MSRKLKVYEGTLVPLAWDHKNNITSLGLYTADGRDIRIINKKEIKRLKNLINHPVSLRGELRTLESGEEVLELNKIGVLKKLKQKILENFEEEEFTLTLPSLWEGEVSFA